jgi:hypothetical protein
MSNSEAQFSMCTVLRNMPLVLLATAVSTEKPLASNSLIRMAPPLAELQHAQIRAMTLRKRPPAKIADAATCSERGVYRIQKKLRCFGSTKAPSNSVGRP